MHETDAETLERIRALSGKFRNAARQADLVLMDEILGERRALLATLQDRGGVQPVDGAERRRCEELLAEILAADRDAERAIEQVRAEMGTDLVALGAGRRGLDGYDVGRRRNGKWIDERG